MTRILDLVKETLAGWREDHGPRLAAALSYYAVFSIAPILLLGVAMSNAFFGKAEAEHTFYEATSGFLGSSTSKAFADILKTASETGNKTTATILGTAFLIFAAMGVFVQLSESLNFIFRCEDTHHKTFFQMLRDRLVGLLIALGSGVILLASMGFSAWLSAIDKYYELEFPIWRTLDYAISFVLVLTSFALLYRLIPAEENVTWKSAFGGAAVSGVLFALLKAVFAYYVKAFNPASAYGAAGSLVVVLLSVYFSAQIFFLGAEFAKALLRREGQKELQIA